jgi:hypothetical protein
MRCLRASGKNHEGEELCKKKMLAGLATSSEEDHKLPIGVSNLYQRMMVCRA